MAQLLIDYRADINRQRAGGLIPLHLSSVVGIGLVEMIKLLSENGLI